MVSGILNKYNNIYYKDKRTRSCLSETFGKHYNINYAWPAASIVNTVRILESRHLSSKDVPKLQFGLGEGTTWKGYIREV